MSRVGKMPITVPGTVQVAFEGAEVRVRGPKGTLTHRVPSCVQVEVEGDTLHVRRSGDGKSERSLHGLTRKLLANMVEGVSQGFRRVLEINGVGYRAESRDGSLHLTLGFSHPVVFPLPEGVSASVERQTVITLECHDKQVLGQAAAELRRFRPPEPYKGKGIRYQGEAVARKAGKAMGGGSG